MEKNILRLIGVESIGFIGLTSKSVWNGEFFLIPSGEEISAEKAEELIRLGTNVEPRAAKALADLRFHRNLKETKILAAADFHRRLADMF